ncbi:TPA: hypothetical protein ACGOVU_001102 [Streptococcus suis]
MSLKFLQAKLFSDKSKEMKETHSIKMQSEFLVDLEQELFNRNWMY